MKEFFKLTDDDKEELMGIAERLRKSAEKNLAPKPMPNDLTEDEVAFAEKHPVPENFFDFFAIDHIREES